MILLVMILLYEKGLIVIILVSWERQINLFQEKVLIGIILVSWEKGLKRGKSSFWCIWEEGLLQHNFVIGKLHYCSSFWYHGKGVSCTVCLAYICLSCIEKGPDISFWCHRKMSTLTFILILQRKKAIIYFRQCIAMYVSHILQIKGQMEL